MQHLREDVQGWEDYFGALGALHGVQVYRNRCSVQGTEVLVRVPVKGSVLKLNDLIMKEAGMRREGSWLEVQADCKCSRSVVWSTRLRTPVITFLVEACLYLISYENTKKSPLHCNIINFAEYSQACRNLQRK